MIHGPLRPNWRDLTASASERSFPRLSSGLQGAASMPLDRGSPVAVRVPVTGRVAGPHSSSLVRVRPLSSPNVSLIGGASDADPLAEQIHTALARSPDGLTRTQIRDLCQRNLPTERVEHALNTLAAAGRAQQQRTLTGGRPAELWTAAPAPRT